MLRTVNFTTVSHESQQHYVTFGVKHGPGVYEAGRLIPVRIMKPVVDHNQREDQIVLHHEIG